MLDSRIPLMAQGLNLEPRSNALMRLTQLQSAQQGNALRQMQVQQLQQAMAAEAEQRKAEAAKQQELDAYLASLSGKTGPPQPFNPVEALRRTGDQKLVEFLANAPNLGRAEVARVLKRAGQGGRPESVQMDRFGNPVGAAIPEPVEAKIMDLGGVKKAYDPYGLTPGQSFETTMTPGEKDASERGWANVKIARQQAAEGGKPPAGYRWKQDGTLEAIPGGPADQKATAEGQKAEARKSLAASNAANVLDIVNEARNMVGLTTTGVGGLAAKLPMTEARDLKGKLDTIKANLGFDRLQAMREASPTGGALGQVAVQELQSLQATVASLDQLQSPGQLRQALDRIDRHYTNWAKAAGVELPKKPTLDSKAIMTEADRIIGIGR